MLMFNSINSTPKNNKHKNKILISIFHESWTWFWWKTSGMFIFYLCLNTWLKCQTFYTKLLSQLANGYNCDITLTKIEKLNFWLKLFHNQFHRILENLLENWVIKGNFFESMLNVIECFQTLWLNCLINLDKSKVIK